MKWFQGKRVLVTGGAGFIGAHLVRALEGVGALVHVLDDLSTGRAENLRGTAATLWRGGLAQLVDDWSRADLAAFDTVFHLAAMVSVAGSVGQPEACIAANVAGTARLLRCIRPDARVVFASSSAVYGYSQSETDLPDPRSPYAVSKLAGEGLLASSGNPGVALRFFNVYGPGQRDDSPYAGVIARFVRAVKAGEPITVFGDGLQTRDFVHVTDVVRAMLIAASIAGRLEPINVCSGRGLSVLELVNTLCELTGRGLEVRHEEARPGEVRHSVGDPFRASARLGFSAKVQLREGLRTLLPASSPA